MTLHNTYYTLEDNCQINSKAPKRQGKLFKHFCRPILNPTESPNRMSFRNCSLELQHKICEALLLRLLHWNLVSEREHFCQKAFNEMMDKPPSIRWWYMQIWECKYICIWYDICKYSFLEENNSPVFDAPTFRKIHWEIFRRFIIAFYVNEKNDRSHYRV